MHPQREKFNNKFQKKYKHYINSPFTLEFEGIKVHVDENGRVVLGQEGPNDTYDEVVTSAVLITKLSQMLFTTTRVVYSDEPPKNNHGEEQE